MNWKIIQEFPDYAISDSGVLIRVFGGQGSVPGRILKPQINNTGYLQTVLSKNGKRHTVRINRLVLMAFVGDPPPNTEGNHKNGVKADNRVDNLEWITHSENMKHSFKLGLQDNLGENNPRAKLKEWQVRIIRRLLVVGWSCVSIARLFNVTDVLIGRIKHKKAWVHI